MFIHDDARDAPDYGGRVPVDTTPGPSPVCRALKKTPQRLISSAAADPPQQPGLTEPRTCRPNNRHVNHLGHELHGTRFLYYLGP